MTQLQPIWRSSLWKLLKICVNLKLSIWLAQSCLLPTWIIAMVLLGHQRSRWHMHFININLGMFWRNGSNQFPWLISSSMPLGFSWPLHDCLYRCQRIFHGFLLWAYMFRVYPHIWARPCHSFSCITLIHLRTTPWLTSSEFTYLCLKCSLGTFAS